MDDSITAHNDPVSPTTAQIDLSASSQTLMPSGSTVQQTHTCVSCGDTNNDMHFIAVCKHSYCDDCLASYLTSSLEPDGTFPPLCCSLPITIESARPHLHHDMAQRFERKHAEIVAACSLLCAQSRCCVVIPPEEIVEDLGHCSACNTYTCTKCRLQEHKGELCPTDAEQEELMRLARERGWQACYRCKNMIELNFGCNHMT